MTKAILTEVLDRHEKHLCELARNIWHSPETAYCESYASTAHADMLRSAGFRVRHGLKDLPTAVLAEYGEGTPLVGILGEYDALPRLSQMIVPVREPVANEAAGHGCGHNLLGTAGIGAAIAIKEAIDAQLIQGTIRYYGCPAEETLAGKGFMAREGVFDDLDACFSWHPASMNAVWGCSFLAMNSVLFKFRGRAAHAAAAPHLGRSALDGVELMNVGANYMREHVHEKTRLHYSIVNGGGAPNTVPAEAEVWYYVRAPKRAQVEEVYAWLQDIARGAALMSGTTVEWKLLAGCYDVLPNRILGQILHTNMLEMGGPRFTDADRAFAGALRDTMTESQRREVMDTYFAPVGITASALHEGVAAVDDESKVMAGSTDVGDVSRVVPFAQFTAATWPVGTPAHSWQATAASGSGIGLAAMMFASKVLAGAAYDLMAGDMNHIHSARVEFEGKTSQDRYKSPLPKDLIPPSQ